MAQDAITKYRRLEGVNSRNYFSVLGAGKSEIKVPVDWVPDEDSLHGWQTAAFLLCPPMVEGE